MGSLAPSQARGSGREIGIAQHQARIGIGQLAGELAGHQAPIQRCHSDAGANGAEQHRQKQIAVAAQIGELDCRSVWASLSAERRNVPHPDQLIKMGKLRTD